MSQQEKVRPEPRKGRLHSRMIGQAQDEASLPPQYDTRTRLLIGAMELFARNGFEATTMRDLAAFSGITAPTIYNYFKSKEDILGEALIWGMNDFTAFVIQPTEHIADPVERLRATLQRHLLYQLNNPVIAKAFGAVRLSPALAREQTSEYFQTYRALLRKYFHVVYSLINEVISRNNVEGVNGWVAAHALVSMHDEIRNWNISKSRTDDIELMEMFWSFTKSVLKIS